MLWNTWSMWFSLVTGCRAGGGLCGGGGGAATAGRPGMFASPGAELPVCSVTCAKAADTGRVKTALREDGKCSKGKALT